MVLVEPDGTVVQLWDAASSANGLVVTNACNCCCLMCPQPPAPDGRKQLEFNFAILRGADMTRTQVIVLSGGEPTIRIDDLVTIVDFLRNEHADKKILLLTNGRAFSNFGIAKRLAMVHHPDLIHCVSLCADVPRIHDAITRAPGSFDQTIRGLHNLARLGQKVEIRVVVVRQNFERLAAISEFIYRNFPFAIHVALMGMETTGLAVENIDDVWVDPVDYVPSLREAVRHLHRRALSVSMYNLPLCVVPPELRQFARDSIAGWKKTFLRECSGCGLAEHCSGVFATSVRQSAGIRAVNHPTQGPTRAYGWSLRMLNAQVDQPTEEQ